MKETLSIETERMDDIPLRLTHMQRMNVAELLDKHIPTHGHRKGLEAIFVGLALLRHRGTIAFLAYVLSDLALLAFSLPISQNILAFVVLPAAFGVGFGMNIMA